MMYAKVINNTVTEWPVSEIQIINRGESTDSYTVIADSPRPQCDEQMQYVREVTPKIIDGVLTRLFEVQTRPRDEIIRLQTDDLAGIRYRKETGGIELEGMKILTDRESQAQLTGVYQSLASGLINANRLESAGWLDDGDKGADRAGSHSRCRVFCRRKSGIGTDSAF
ncbi:hypothetical protein ATT74_23945 [Salmonella enterica subsp. enterica serovar Panama]|uniref:DUF4376 domain-containing protein n=1 Tax=Salmonella enterica subsp. enterica serovar Panama TaxID=29472 RepID=A0A619AHU4_SALET|nr:hypothetical protein [Salmonella enterica subsp. enterica serovar Newport]ECT5252667.1 hypothetical protein [Salmonella enterica subsp. enterica serovar Panama]EGU5384093.1 DUF4376 domain-containing protein [Salmonella enterica]ELP2195134.1 DUF4376 domain-containing protein [Salmonella enterica subsp. enterica serovar Champaign]ECX3498366.1 DUF4376 domain-containing protein [Salmonella enterica subsp. enterica serovar Panama]